MRRLFSTFARGRPGAGLLLMRLVAGFAILTRSFERLGTGPPIGQTIVEVVEMAVGVLLSVGLWTPISGSLVAGLGLWGAISQPGDQWANISLGTIGAALALIGPGAWSIDARLFGWKRIEIHDPKR